MADGYHLNTLIDVTTTLLDFVSDAVNDLRDFVSELGQEEEEEEGQPKE